LNRLLLDRAREEMIGMRKVLLMLTALAPVAFAQSVTYTATYSGLPVFIPPNSNNAYAAVRVLMPKSLIIQKVTVTMQVAYPNIIDLNVFVYSPQGTRTKLLEHNCSGLVNIDTTFDDAAPNRFASFCPVEAGRGPFSGNEPLANSNGQNSLGYWLLAVQNNKTQNTGFVNSLSFTITGTVGGPAAIVPQTIVSTSSFKSGSVSPGELISVYGANLGPSTPVSASGSGDLPTSLGGTTVTFDGTAVPLYYVANNEVSIQTPVTLNPGATTKIQVTSTYGASSTVTLPVVPARPGIFTIESMGGGQASAVNQDGSINGNGTVTANGSDKPAPAGSVISIYASGLGPVNPVIPAGTPAPSNPLSVVTLSFSATIAGLPATVTYAGAAPTLVGGYQVNVQIPDTAPAGQDLIVLSSGSNFSQDAVFITVGPKM
jgi:uncharacterized protein (TIGR03437 family)